MSFEELLRDYRRETATGQPGRAVRAFWVAVDAELSKMFGGRYSPRVASKLISRIEFVVWKKLDSFEPRGPDSFERWLRSIARREELQFRKERGRAQARARRLEIIRSPQPTWGRLSTWIFERERWAVIVRYMRELLTRQREALLRDASDLARYEQITVRAARMRRRRALRRLWRILAQSRHRSELVRIPSS